MHTLRVHCGSFVYDALREQWLTEEEREEVEGAESRDQSVCPVMSSTGEADVVAGAEEKACGGDGEKGEVPGLPREWPLFETSALTTIRVVSYKQRQGNIVSVILHCTRRCLVHCLTISGLAAFLSEYCSLSIYGAGLFPYRGL